jgi:MFS family permease
VFAYGTGTLKVSRDLLLMAVLAASLVSFISIPLAGHMSDRFGRKRVYIIGAILTGIFGWLYFAMLDTVMPFWISLAIVLSLIPHDIMYGPQAALIATALFASYGSWVAISVYITICSVISVVSAAMLTDYTGKGISAEYTFGEQ